METKSVMMLQHRPILVIGYGSSLRGDDAVGRHVAELIDTRLLSKVRAVSVLQLVPELAASIAEASAVIFVDAYVAGEGDSSLNVREISYSARFGVASHESGPRELLALAALCFGRAPRAWIVAVPAVDFSLSSEISWAAKQNVDAAVRHVLALVDELCREEVAYA